MTPGALDWPPLFTAFADAFDWALDLSKGIARYYPDEVAAIERVRTFVQKRTRRQPARVREDDLLFTLGLLLAALERDRMTRTARTH